MNHFITVTYGPHTFGTFEADGAYQTGNDSTTKINLANIPDFPNIFNTRRRRRRPGDGPLQRLLDPEREHPILKQLFLAAAPLIQGFLTTQLPALLGVKFPTPDPDEIND